GGKAIATQGFAILSRGFIGAAFPIIGARLADGAADGGFQALEGGERAGRSLEEGQGDEASQELLVPILVARGEAGMLHDLQRLSGIGGGQSIARLDAAFVPPARRMLL